MSAGPFHAAWLEAVRATLADGAVVAPRGKVVKERLGVSVKFDGARALLVHPGRDLNYRFAVAEFLWIACGSDDLETVAKYNSQLRQYSDDGLTLAGAYGPRLEPQWDYVLSTLRRDPDSRQAVASVWTPSPGPSKDVPCTVAAQFLNRDGRLHGLWTMRSNDLWFGLPYDAFTFARLTACVAGQLGLPVGDVTVTAGSSHLYADHWTRAGACVDHHGDARSVTLAPLPGFPPDGAERLLRAGSRLSLDYPSPWYGAPWSYYAAAVEAPTKARALALLEVSGLEDLAA